MAEGAPAAQTEYDAATGSSDELMSSEEEEVETHSLAALIHNMCTLATTCHIR